MDINISVRLLSCNFSATKVFSQNGNMVGALSSVIGDDKNAQNITQASVYFADLTTGQWASVNPMEKYYPASLGKVPIMMAYYAMAQNTSSILDDIGTYPTGLPDLNTQQEIPPENAITPGKDYTVSQMIDYMIKYSDNDAADALAALADQDVLRSVYSDLQVPLSNDVTASTSDIMTALSNIPYYSARCITLRIFPVIIPKWHLS